MSIQNEMLHLWVDKQFEIAFKDFFKLKFNPDDKSHVMCRALFLRGLNKGMELILEEFNV